MLVWQLDTARPAWAEGPDLRRAVAADARAVGESGGMPTSASELLSAAYNDADRTIDLRRRLHRHPEIGLHLPATQATVLEAFADLPVELTTGTTTSSVVGVLRGARPGPTYLLRGDMDALPVQEDTGLPFASEVPGAMHACGHDTHVAMLLGAARLLAERRDLLAGQVVFMVQPGEEGFHGARYMLEEGLLDVVPEAPVSGAFALHTISNLASGSINVRPGPMMAAADQWQIRFAAGAGTPPMPHAAADPIPVAAEIVLALQSMVTRRVDVFDPAVVTVAHIEAGSTSNVIPDSVFMEGTIRTLSAERRADVVAAVQRVGYAHRRGARADRRVRARGGLPGHGQRRRRRRQRAGDRRRAAGGAGELPVAGTADGRGGLLLRAGAGARRDGVPGRLPARCGPGDRAAQPLEPGRLRRGAAAGRGRPLRADGAAGARRLSRDLEHQRHDRRVAQPQERVTPAPPCP